MAWRGVGRRTREPAGMPPSDVKDILGIKPTAGDGAAAPAFGAGGGGSHAKGGDKKKRDTSGAVATSIMPSFQIGMKETRRKEARNTFWEWRGFTVRAEGSASASARTNHADARMRACRIVSPFVLPILHPRVF